MSSATDQIRGRLLDIGSGLLRKKGLNSFSFRDLAAAIGIKSSSVHYHFPTKLDLARTLLDDYRKSAVDLLRGPESAADKVDAFLAMFIESAREGQICLAGMLASDFVGIDDSLRDDIERFFQNVEAELAILIGEIRGGEPDPDSAGQIIDLLEGALLLSRVSSGTVRVERAIMQARKLITSKPQ